MPIWAFQKRIITSEKAAFVSSFADCDELFVINQRFPKRNNVHFVNRHIKLVLKRNARDSIYS